MKKALVAVMIGLVLVLAAAIYFYITTAQDKNALTDELMSTQRDLASTQSELVSTQAELATAKDDLASAKGDLTTTKDDLTASQTELDDTKATLTSTLSELSDTRETLASTESELDTTSRQLTSKLAELSSANTRIDDMQETIDSLEDSLSDSNERLAIAEETLDGLGITVAASSECDDVALVDNPQAQNPTWNELMSFLAEDHTEQNEYIIDVYDCSQFSGDVHNNAEEAGIRAAEVQVWFRNETTGHALNAFITTDYGLVWVDCTEAPDTVARVKLNKEYRAVETYLVAGKNARNDAWWDSLTLYYYIVSETGGYSIVSDIMIYW